MNDRTSRHLPPGLRRRRQGAAEILDIDNEHASAAISLFGGQVLSFRPRHDGRERLWLSERALWDGSKSPRGGIPVCWPWFGAHANPGLPAHGFVRTRPWELRACRRDDRFTEVELAPLACEGEGFDGQAGLLLRVRVGERLTLSLITENLGIRPFDYRCALHSYFQVADIGAAELRGLTGDYSDKTRDWRHFPTPLPYRFSGETDRIHLQPAAALSIEEPGQRTRIGSEGHDSVVVWNPWRGRAAELADMDEDGWRRMLCVETALTRGRHLQPGESHTLSQLVD